MNRSPPPRYLAMHPVASTRNLSRHFLHQSDFLHHPAMSTFAWYAMTNHKKSHCLAICETATHLDLDPLIVQVMRRYKVDCDCSPYLTVVEAAAFLRLNPRTLDSMRCNGVGPIYCKHGGRIRQCLRADLESPGQSTGDLGPRTHEARGPFRACLIAGQQPTHPSSIWQDL